MPLAFTIYVNYYKRGDREVALSTRKSIRDAPHRTWTNWTLPGHVFAGRVTNSIQTIGGFSFTVSTGTGGAQNILLNATAGPVLFKQLQESVLLGVEPPSIGNQCGRKGNL